jgi:hypothetical protein
MFQSKKNTFIDNSLVTIMSLVGLSISVLLIYWIYFNNLNIKQTKKLPLFYNEIIGG